MQAAPEELLIVFSMTARIVFQIIIWPIVIVGIIGNVSVVLRILFADTSKNNILKPFHRSSLMSLATADILLLVTSGSNSLLSVGQTTILWRLPDWACNVIPYLQTVSVLVASLTLAGVAVDRYAAIRSKYPMTKGLKFHWAVAFFGGLWATAFGAAFPVLGAYNAEPLVVINSSTYYVGKLCVVANRSEASVIFTVLFAVIFVPLAVVFILIHALLARNISQRNSPRDNLTQQTNNDSSQFSNENSTVSTSLGKSKRATTKKVGTTPSHVARKRRTVRVILVLIIVFAVCRLPHWSFLLYKLHSKTSHNYTWYLSIVMTLLSLFNAALHPFFYAFLNEALSLVNWIRAWCTKTRTTPTTKTTVRPISDEEIERAESAKVPRGPYHIP